MENELITEMKKIERVEEVEKNIKTVLESEYITEICKALETLSKDEEGLMRLIVSIATKNAERNNLERKVKNLFNFRGEI